MYTKKGFTLVEMLVVVAIIGILAALLLPSLQKALDSSRQIVCANNLKQCHTALITYSDDWRGKIMVSWTVNGSYNFWTTFISGRQNETSSVLSNGPEYLAAGEVFGCPSNPRYPSDRNKYATGSARLAGFGIYNAGWTHKNMYRWNFAKSVTVSGSPSFGIETHRLVKVPEPSRIVMLGDSLSMWNNWNMPMYSSFNPRYANTHGSRIHLLHGNERASVAFYDGHVESMDLGELYEGTASRFKKFFDKNGSAIDLPNPLTLQ